MAALSNWTGFPSDLGLNVETENIIRSPTTAYSGLGFLRHGRTTSGSTNGVTFGLFGSIGTVTDGQSGGYRVRVVFRLPTVAPNVARSLWYTVAGASSWQLMGVLIDTDRTLKCFTNIANGGPYVAGSASAAVPLGYADNEGWVTVDIEATVVANGSNDSMTVDADITFADGTQESITATTGLTSLGTPNFVSGYSLLGVPGASGFTTNWIGCVDVGQWIQHGATNADFASLTALPPVGTKHAEVLIAAQGSNNGIAYSSGATFRHLRKAIPVASITTDTRLTTSTAGQQSDFTHDGVARFGASTTYGIKVIQLAAAGGTPTAQFMIGGSNVVGRGTLGASVHPDYVDFTSRSQATFDALQVGVQSALSSGTYDCQKIQIEVLHDGATFGDEELALGNGYQQEWLTWTGNTGLRTLTGASFRPTLAIIFSPAAVVTPKVVSVLYPGVVMNATGTWDTSAFYGFTADGLIVDGLLNTSAQEYRALLIRDDGSPTYDVSGPTPVITGYTFYFTQGSYGQITGQPYDFGERIQFAPEALLVFPAHNASSASTLMKTRDMGTGLSVQLTVAAAAESGARMASFDANGFTVGTSLSNQVSATIPCLWFAWSEATALYNQLRTRPIAAVTSVKSDTVSTLVMPYLFSFEEDDVAVRPTLLNSGHTRVTGSVTSATVAAFNIVAGSNRRLVIVALTYGDSGVRSCTVGGSSSGVTLLEDIDQGFMRYCVYEVIDPAVATPDIVYSSTTNLSSIQLGVFHVEDSDGVRWINFSSTVSQISAYYASRLNDLVLSMFSSDPLDSGSTYTSPGGAWTELWNDGSVSAAGAANVRDGLADAEVSITYTEGGTGTPDVYSHLAIGLAPVRPVWDARAVWFKASQTNAPISRLRLDDAAYSSTSCSLWTTQAIATTLGIQTLDDYHTGIYRVNAGGAQTIQLGWVFAFGPAGVVVALSPPTGMDDAYTTPFETLLTVAAAGVLANDDENGGGAMTAVLVDDVGVGTLALASDGSFTYQPPLGFVGSTTFTYTPVNAGGTGTLATVTITVLASAAVDLPVIIELRFGDGYRSLIKTHPAILAFWYLSDVGEAQAQDEIVDNDAGIYTGSAPARGLLPEFGLSRRFNGVDEWVEIDFDQWGVGTDSPLSLTATVRVDAIGAAQCIVNSGASGAWLGVDATGHFSFGKNGGTKVTDATALTVDTIYQVSGTFDGTDCRLYVDGVLVGGPTAISVGPSSGGFIGKNASEEFEGDIQGVGAFAGELSADFCELLYEATVWTDVSSDARASVPVITDRGIHSDDPRQRLSPTGTARFALNNAHDNTGGLLGYYSPDHANCRDGFQRGIPVRVSFEGEIQFIGTLREATPVSGKWGERMTYCFATDWMDEAARFTIDGVETQEDITADEAIELILNRMPNKPHEINLGTGTDTYPIALDNSETDASTMSELGRLAMSEMGLIYVTGPGVLTFEPRGTRISGSSTPAATIDNEMISAEIENSTDQLVNRVRITVHPRRVDAAATTVLFVTENRVRIDNGFDIEMFFAFRDPSQKAARVGGIEVVSPVANTHYTLNSAEDGSGTNVSTDPSIEVVWRISGNGVYLEVNNGFGQPVYLDLEVLGKGVYDFEPVVLIAKDDTLLQQIGVQEIEIDMPYQTSAAVGNDTAQLLLNTFANQASRLRSMQFQPTSGNETLFNAALDVEIGSRVTVNEDVTAIAGEFFVNAVSHSWIGDRQVVTTWWLAPANTEDYWIMDVSELDIGTRLSY